MNLRISKKKIFYHTNGVAHFNSILTSTNAGRKLAVLIFLPGGTRKENISDAQAKNLTSGR